MLELSVEENHEVTIAGKTEKRTALFGIFEVNNDAKKLNAEGQKVYPSIEIDLDFAGAGEAYMMGCALTDSPAAIGTERLTFNRTAPGHETIKESDLGGLLEFAEDSPAADAAAQEVKGLFSKLTELLSGPAPQPKEDPKPAAASQFDPADFTRQLGETLDSAFTKMGAVNKAGLDALEAKFTALSETIESTAAPGQPRRPIGTGSGSDYKRTDC